jgi:hypothetical protein
MMEKMLNGSSATDEFRSAVSSFLATGGPSERIRFDHRSPRVKVERVMTKLLESEPDLAVEAVTIHASSGCEYYRGELTVDLADGRVRRFAFDWDCRWRAEEQGWTDYFGLPDQMRAAREFGYDCFRRWDDGDPSKGAAA